MSEYLIGIDVGGTNIKLMIMDDRRNVINRKKISTEYEKGYDSISDRMICKLEEMFDENGIASPKVAAIGMGLPGMVDAREQKTVYLSKLCWDGFNPCEKIGTHFNAPTVIDNDANVNALGEYEFGEGRGSEVMALITLGTGVGCGLIIGGRIFGGASNMAGELGHMIVEVHGDKICLCGRRGHLEAYCSGTSLERDAKEMLFARKNSLLCKYLEETNGVFDNSMVTRGAAAGDKVSCELLGRFTHFLAAGAANLMSLLNPDVILLGGGISNAGSILTDAVNKKTREMVIHDRSWCPVKIAGLGADAGMYGACAMAMRKAGIN